MKNRKERNEEELPLAFLPMSEKRPGPLLILGIGIAERNEREREEDPPENWGERKGNGEM